MNNPSAYEAAAWIEQAECSRYGAASMFPHEGDEAGIEAAKANCNVCPVLAKCLKGALERGEQWGIWGGMTVAERKTYRRRQLRGARPVTDLPL